MVDSAASKRGFTLIELMVTLAVLGILLAVALPSFTMMIQNSRLVGQANDLVTMLNYARSEAVKRNQSITVCSSTDGASCAGSTTWDSGLIVFVDNNGDGAVDAGEQVLQVRPKMEGSNTLRSGAQTRITYQANGFLGVVGSNDVFRLCDARGTTSARAITISMQGRVSTSTGTASCP